MYISIYNIAHLTSKIVFFHTRITIVQNNVNNIVKFINSFGLGVIILKKKKKNAKLNFIYKIH